MYGLRGTKVADIEWPLDNEEAVVAMLMDKVADHHEKLYGNGRAGVLEFIAGFKGQMRLIMALLIFISVVTGVLTMLIAWKSIERESLHIPAISQSHNPESAYAKTQDARLPPIAR